MWDHIIHGALQALLLVNNGIKWLLLGFAILPMHVLAIYIIYIYIYNEQRYLRAKHSLPIPS